MREKRAGVTEDELSSTSTSSVGKSGQEDEVVAARGWWVASQGLLEKPPWCHPMLVGPVPTHPPAASSLHTSISWVPPIQPSLRPLCRGPGALPAIATADPGSHRSSGG